jgi:hypothetical protein
MLLKLTPSVNVEKDRLSSLLTQLATKLECLPWLAFSAQSNIFKRDLSLPDRGIFQFSVIAIDKHTSLFSHSIRHKKQ